MFIRPYPSPVALLLVFAFASFSCGSDGDADEGKVSVVQGPGSKSAEDEQARLDARLPGRLAEARVFHTATRLDDGRVMVTGGKGRVIKGAPSATAEIFDLAVGDWVLVETGGRPMEGLVAIAPAQVLYSEVRGPLEPVLGKVSPVKRV